MTQPAMPPAGTPQPAAAAPGAAPAVNSDGQPLLEEPLVETGGMPLWLETAFPWMVSVTLHLGIVLVLIFLFSLGRRVMSDQDKEPIIVPQSFQDPQSDGRPGGNPNPGMNDPSREAMQDKFKEIKTNEGWAQNQGDAANATYLEGSGGDATADFIALGTGGSVGRGTGGNGTGDGGPLAMYGTPGGGSGSGPKSSFWGTGGGGATRIVYVLDHSGSMLDSFDFLREEVRRSTRNLIPAQSFSVIMFSEHTDFAYPKTEQLTRALPDSKRDFESGLDQVKAQGQNDDLLDPFVDAFSKAFKMKPQLIYFLTDGNFDPRLTDKVRELNKDHKVRIHTYAFVQISKESAEQLQILARENGGKYRFISDKDLGK